MENKQKIGIAKENIKKNEIIAIFNIFTNEIRSSCIKFLPYGKKKLLKKLERK